MSHRMIFMTSMYVIIFSIICAAFTIGMSLYLVKTLCGVSLKTSGFRNALCLFSYTVSLCIR